MLTYEYIGEYILLLWHDAAKNFIFSFNNSVGLPSYDYCSNVLLLVHVIAINQAILNKCEYLCMLLLKEVTTTR